MDKQLSYLFGFKFVQRDPFAARAHFVARHFRAQVARAGCAAHNFAVFGYFKTLGY